MLRGGERTLDEKIIHEEKVLAKPALNEFSTLETLGTGTFGRVLLCRYNKTSKYYALKILKKTQIVKLKQVEHVNNEKKILEAISHPFIVKLHLTLQDERNLFMVLEYVPGGELFSHLKKYGQFSESTARFYAAEIILAIEYLHSLNIIYRDMKPENLLLDQYGHIKLTDFGFAKRIGDRTWTLCGTPEYVAPEIIQSKGHGKAVDWWAIGILIYEMLVGYPPFYDHNPFTTYEKILSARVSFPVNCGVVSRDLITRLLNRDVSKRLGNLCCGSADVKRHPWFSQINWNHILSRSIRPPIVPVYSYPGDTSNFDRYPNPPQEPEPEPGIDPYRYLFSDF